MKSNLNLQEAEWRLNDRKKYFPNYIRRFMNETDPIKIRICLKDIKDEAHAIAELKNIVHELKEKESD